MLYTPTSNHHENSDVVFQKILALFLNTDGDIQNSRMDTVHECLDSNWDVKMIEMDGGFLQFRDIFPGMLFLDGIQHLRRVKWEETIVFRTEFLKNVDAVPIIHLDPNIDPWDMLLNTV